MKGILIIISLNFIFTNLLWGQVIDSFNDGDFFNNPTWGGDTGSWQIVTNATSGPNVTSSNTLRLNSPDDGSTSQYLSTQRTDSWGDEQSWGFWLGRRSSSPATSTNHSIVWLWANESNLESGTVDGYRIRFGDNSNNDEIVLQRVDNGNQNNILTSSGAVTNGLSDIGFLVRVTRTNTSLWTLYTSTLPTANGDGASSKDIPSAANTTVNQGSITDNTYTNFNNGFFGFMAIHTTGSTARTGAEFDQLYFDIASDASLPVELTSFTARQEGSAVVLEWVTESEVDNLGFILERKHTLPYGYPSPPDKDSRAGQEENEIGEWQEIASYKTHPELQGQGSVTQRTEYSYTDNTVEVAKTYQYRLADVSYSGEVRYHKLTMLTVEEFEPLLNSFTVYQNYPNPFNTQTTISYYLPNESYVTVSIYDLTGRKLETLVSASPSRRGGNRRGRLVSGRHKVIWDASNITSGIYIYRVETELGAVAKKLVLLK